MVPHSLAPNLDNETTLKQFEQCQEQLQTPENVSPPIDLKVPELTPEREKLLFSKIDLTALIEEARQLFCEFAHIFALESTDMGILRWLNTKLGWITTHPSRKGIVEFHPICLMKLRTT